jgi:hypothetical protein
MQVYEVGLRYFSLASLFQRPDAITSRGGLLEASLSHYSLLQFAQGIFEATL